MARTYIKVMQGYVEAYIAEQQHDSNATTLWMYFQTITNWGNTIAGDEMA